MSVTTRKKFSVIFCHSYVAHCATGGAEEDSLAGIPDPVERFEDFPGVSAGLLRSFGEQGFTEPTPIQASVW